MKKQFSLLMGAVLLASVFAPALVVYPQLASDARATTAVLPQHRSDLASSPVRTVANFILQDPPIVVQARATQPEPLRSRKINFESVDVQGYEARIEAAQRGFEARVLQTFPDARIVTELRKLVNVVAVEAPGFELNQMAAFPGVSEGRVAREYHALLDKSVPLINAPTLWNKLGGSQSAGQGIKIAILDTGIDIGNPLFSDSGFAYPQGFPKGNPSFVNKKVITAKVFLGDASADPSDQDGHGTNVAGIAAGDFNTPTPLGSISGVAPAAYLGNYRVLDSNGSGSDSLIASGIEAALTDGFDIASLSLGQAAQTQFDIMDVAVENAVAAGMIVVVAAGNDGPKAQTIDSPGLAPHAITVAASSNSHFIGPTVSVTGPGSVPANLQGIESVAGGPTSGCPLNPAIGPTTYVSESSLPGNNSKGCQAGTIPPNAFAGDAALIQRGTCLFAQKILNAQQNGAIFAIVYNQSLKQNPQTGGNNLVAMDTTGTSIPSVFVGRQDGLALVSWVSQHPSAQVKVDAATEFADINDVVASFSSRGPTLTGFLKPDVAAPGVNIYSGAIKSCAEVSDPSGFVAVSGTSQATPHVAGAAALMKQLHPAWTPDQIKSALVSSASSQVFDDTAKTTQSDVLEVGGGRIDLAAASSVTITTDPVNLSFGVSKLKKTQNLSQTLTITNVTTGAASLSVSVTQLNPDSHVTVSPSQTSLSLAQGTSNQVTISITARKAAARRDYTGFIVITPESGSPQRVPYWLEL